MQGAYTPRGLASNLARIAADLGAHVEQLREERQLQRLLRKATPDEPPVPRLKPMMRSTVFMWRKRQSWKLSSTSTSSSHSLVDVPMVLGVLVDARRTRATRSRSSVCGLRPVALEQPLRHRVAAAARGSAGTRRRGSAPRARRAARACASGSCANTASMPAFLLPSRNSSVRYCSDWKPDDAPEHVAELRVLGRRQRLQHRPLLGHLALHLLARGRGA